MRVINKARGKGKTTGLLYTSSIMNIPILTFNRENCDILKQNADRLGFEIPEPVAVTDLYHAEGKVRSMCVRDVLVDETLTVLENLLKHFGVNPIAATLTVTEGVHYN